VARRSDVSRPNLARSPFVDSRPIWITGAVLGVLALALTLVNVLQFFSARGQETTLRARMATLRVKREALRKDVEDAGRRLGAVDWKRLDGEVASVSGVVGKRRLAWSDLLSDLERVVPWDVRLVSISPAFNDKGEITVVLRGVASSRQAWLNLLARCFADDHFSEPVPMSEEAPGANNAQGYSFDLRVKYWPEGRK
jgi:hypothetical protein